MDNNGGDGDVDSDNDSHFNNSYDGDNQARGSFKESRGHKAGRLTNRKHNKSLDKKKSKCKC